MSDTKVKTMGFHISVKVEMPFEQAVKRVTDELKKEGFGILSDIDLEKILKTKLGEDTGKYRILGACNPKLAFRALQAESRIGVMLPCNVIMRQIAKNSVEVSAVDPEGMMGASQNPDLRELARDVRKKLSNVLLQL